MGKDKTPPSSYREYLALVQAVLDGKRIQFSTAGRVWTTYPATATPAAIMASIMAGPLAHYRVLPADAPKAFQALWDSQDDHEGIEFDTALEWWKAGSASAYRACGCSS